MKPHTSAARLALLILASCATTTRSPSADDFQGSVKILEPFTTDGCSMWPDGDWQQCCIIHDIAYWKGGRKEERLRADEELGKCVALVRGKLGPVMEIGTNLGGSPKLPTTYAWGYGWKGGREYGPLTADEQKQVDRYWALTLLEPQILKARRTSDWLLKPDQEHRKKEIQKNLEASLNRPVDLNLFLPVRSQQGRAFQVFENSCPEAYFLIVFSYKSDKVLQLRRYGECE